MSELPRTTHPDVDLNRPSAARVYDFFLGGAHNFRIDRDLAVQIERMTPNIAETMRANRTFLRRAIQMLLNAGIRQFLDIGSGIPTVGNVHEIVEAAAADARTVYIDIDPVAVAHSEAILKGSTSARVLRGDLCQPEDLLRAVRELGFLDFDRPIAVVLAGVVHFVGDDEGPDRVTAVLRKAVVAGSYLVISHATFEHQPPEVIEAQQLAASTGTPIVLRSKETILGFFGGFELVDPALVFITAWRPEAGPAGPAGPADPAEANPAWIGAYGGVARKPGPDRTRLRDPA